MNISANIFKCVNNERFVSRKDDNLGILRYRVKGIWFVEWFNIEADKQRQQKNRRMVWTLFYMKGKI